MAEKVSLTDWLPVGGEMGERIRAFDWAKTAIGSAETWSPALRMMVRFLLANCFPLLLWWGPQYVSIYNDAYRPVLGTKHPHALGQPLSECWSEIWHVLRPLVDTPFNGGQATWNDDIVLEINRHGFVEETHFTIAYSPVPDESVSSGIGGVLATVHETTEKVVGERRVIVLRDLGARAIEAKSAEEACTVAADALARHTKDIPFALLYLIEVDGKQARLASASGAHPGEAITPTIIELGAGSNEQPPWPLAEAARTESIQVVDDLAGRFGTAVPAGPWCDPPRQAVIVPIRSNIAHKVAGFLVAGVSARLKLDELYRSFYELLASQIATAVANARAYEEERRRAEALAEIDRAKIAFFSNVSHEFRTPLTLILGPLEDTLAQSKNLPAADRHRLETVQRNSLRMQKLVNTLLDFSRIEAGRIRASYEPTDLSALTAELAGVFRSAIERAGITLVVDCSPLGETVYVDREMWEKVVLNLVSNAFKFTLEGEIEISLRETKGAVELIVRDTGTGIPTEELPRLFERFHRVKGARGRSYEGSGIGLALVEELVKLHCGDIRVESEVGRGSRFIVSVPLGKSHLPADRIEGGRTASTRLRSDAYVEEALRWLPDVQHLGPPADELPAQPLDHLGADYLGRPPKAAPSAAHRILFADDNTDMREYVRRLLSQAGYEVETVADGLAALRSARECKPHLVLTDVMMPGLDGFHLLREFRADPGLAGTPIILLSARAGEEARIEGLHAGADDYLIKPFSARELLARVESQLKMAHLRGEAIAVAKRLAAIVESSHDAIVSKDLSGIIVSWNEGAEHLFGYSAKEVVGKPVTILFPSDRQDEEASILERVRRGERVDHYETVRCRKDGTFVAVSLTVSPLRDAKGVIVGASKIARDISARKRAEEHQRILRAELDHRVKNVLATVKAIIAQTQETTSTQADFVSGLDNRITSLASIHALLSQGHWLGAALSEIVDIAFAPYGNAEGGGPGVMLKAEAAQAVAMVLHELTTNAAKYGALSNQKGRVSLKWWWQENGSHRRLAIEWQETGGPSVVTPIRHGYGTCIVRELIPFELGGTAEITYASEGVQCRLEIPAEWVNPRSSSNEVVPYTKMKLRDRTAA